MSVATSIPPTAVQGTTPIVGSAVPLDENTSVGFHLRTGDDVDGNWKIYTSATPTNPRPVDGLGADVTANFLTPAIQTVAHGTAATRNQFVQGQFVAGHVWAVFVPTAGTKQVSADMRLAP